MTARKPRSYAEGIEQARALINQGRLADPDEHYPYKADTVRRLVEENPNMGPGDPDLGVEGPDDDRVKAEDFMTSEIASASEAYIEAQAAFLRDSGDGTKAAYDAAKQRLVAARQAHRRNRVTGNVVGVRARRAGE